MNKYIRVVEYSKLYSWNVWEWQAKSNTEK
jgi:hypothetical protein